MDIDESILTVDALSYRNSACYFHGLYWVSVDFVTGWPSEVLSGTGELPVILKTIFRYTSGTDTGIQLREALLKIPLPKATRTSRHAYISSHIAHHGRATNSQTLHHGQYEASPPRRAVVQKTQIPTSHLVPREDPQSPSALLFGPIQCRHDGH